MTLPHPCELSPKRDIIGNSSKENIEEDIIMMNTIKRLVRSPFVTNCLYYGTLFCGAELTQQLVIRKYQPWSQVSPV